MRFGYRRLTVLLVKKAWSRITSGCITVLRRRAGAHAAATADPLERHSSSACSGAAQRAPVDLSAIASAAGK